MGHRLRFLLLRRGLQYGHGRGFPMRGAGGGGTQHPVPHKGIPRRPRLRSGKGDGVPGGGPAAGGYGPGDRAGEGRCRSRRDADREHLPGVGRKHPVLLALYAGKRSPWDANAPLSPRRNRTGHRSGAGDGRRLSQISPGRFTEGRPRLHRYAATHHRTLVGSGGYCLCPGVRIGDAVSN